MALLHHASVGIGILGAAVIVLGVLRGFWAMVRTEVALARGAASDEARVRLRQTLGYHLLLGLEFLIAADIIDTLMKPDPRELIALGAIVAIRTVISFSLNAELKHDRSETWSRPPTQR